MYSSKMSCKSLILVFTLIVYSIGQVTAFNCYVCSSDSDGDCYKKPKQEQYKGNCLNWLNIPELANHLYSGFGSQAQSALNDYARTHPRQLSENEYHCITIEGELPSNNKNHVVRVCSPKLMNCDAWKSMLPGKYPGLKMKSCNTCESDLCNSSSNLSVGFLSLIGSLLAIFSLRH